MSRERESSIDFARGSAMLLVFFAHFSQELTVGPATSGVPLLLFRLGEIAPAMFVLVSGLTLAVVLRHTPPDALPQARMRALDRALFILFVIHGVLLVTDVLLAPYERGLRQVFITDTLALSLIVGAALVPKIGRAGRLAIAGSLYGLGWITHALWQPSPGFLSVADEILTGPTASHSLDYGFPVLEWAGVFLVGTVLGDSFVQARSPSARQRWAARLFLGGLSAVVGAAVLKVSLLIAARSLSHEVLSIFAKAPPGPLYLMFFGGIAVCLIAAATWLSVRGLLPRVNAWFSVLGRNSLFVFVLQSAVFRDLVARLPLEGRPWTWPLAFAAATLLVWALARIWDRVGGNRWLTLGIRHARPTRWVEA